MKISTLIRLTTSLLLIICLFAPVLAIGGREGKKHFALGMKFEDAEQWDKAVEQFALAIAQTPKNAEYRLHYQRSLFNASQMFMKQGNTLAEGKDYAGAYMAFRKAYGYDQTNELAKAEMARMIRLKEILDNPEKKEETVDVNKSPDLKLLKTSYGTTNPDDFVPQKLEKLRDVPFPSGVDIQFLIRELAKDLDLNVLFDEESFRAERKVKIELKNVTAAKALDYIFLQTGLFFSKVGPRTIIVANQNRRQNFQQLILRTFYLGNADPAEVAKTIVSAIPPQPGRTPTGVLTDKSTNSITVRDTEENVKLIGKLIKSLDKDRSEVVMDVNIYEVSKNDLLQIGNQIGAKDGLVNLGGVTPRTVPVGNVGGVNILNTLRNTATGFGAGIFLPTSSLQAFQSKGNTRLLASTQVHAFNNEESTARIGQRVPVQTASVIPFGGTGTGGGGTGGGFPVINYEQVGLTLKFTPIVFPNQDVQVKMEIESKDVAGASSLTPTFTERSIKGTARIQNNRTLLLASVAQGTESDSRSGIPLLSFLPVIGRLFSAPQKENRQVDIVIAVTPRVLRAPIVLEEDLVERPTGSLATPTSSSLEAMIVQEEREEQLAAARRISNYAKIQLPDAPVETPTYVKSSTNEDVVSKQNVVVPNTTITEVSVPSANVVAPKTNTLNLKPIDSSPRTLPIVQTSDDSNSSDPKVEPKVESKVETKQTSTKTLSIPDAKLSLFMPSIGEMKVGEKARISVLISSESEFQSAIVAIGFDPKKVAIRRVSYGDVFGKASADKQATPYFNSNGKMYVTLSAAQLTKIEESDVLAYLEVEALTDGKPEISFIENMFGLINENGQSFVLKFDR
jgi:general secretion pathway protein D